MTRLRRATKDLEGVTAYPRDRIQTWRRWCNQQQCADLNFTCDSKWSTARRMQWDSISYLNSNRSRDGLERRKPHSIIFKRWLYNTQWPNSAFDASDEGNASDFLHHGMGSKEKQRCQCRAFPGLFTSQNRKKISTSFFFLLEYASRSNINMYVSC